MLVGIKLDMKVTFIERLLPIKSKNHIITQSWEMT